jgi:hypothetical protein
MTRVRVGLVMAIVGAALIAWGTLSPPIMTCTNYSPDNGGCTQSIFQEFAVLGGCLLLLVGVVTLFTAIVRHYRSN